MITKKQPILYSSLTCSVYLEERLLRDGAFTDALEARWLCICAEQCGQPSCAVQHGWARRVEQLVTRTCLPCCVCGQKHDSRVLLVQRLAHSLPFTHLAHSLPSTLPSVCRPTLPSSRR